MTGMRFAGFACTESVNAASADSAAAAEPPIISLHRL
jgi:hypothetical protein